MIKNEMNYLEYYEGIQKLVKIYIDPQDLYYDEWIPKHKKNFLRWKETMKNGNNIYHLVKEELERLFVERENNGGRSKKIYSSK